MTPDYPTAIPVPADPSNYRGWHGGERCPSRPISRIVIHITDGHPDPRGTAEMFQQPRHGASAHFVVGQDGTVIQCVALDDIAWHASSANEDSIGIEHSARAPGEWDKLLGHHDPGLSLSPVQLLASAKLVRWLCDRYGLPIDRAHVLGHCEADPSTTHTDCPNAIWDWPAYMVMVSQAAPAEGS